MYVQMLLTKVTEKKLVLRVQAHLSNVLEECSSARTYPKE